MNIGLIPIRQNSTILSIGDFAFASNNLGLGKVAEVFDEEVELEYFQSISEQNRFSFPIKEVIKARVAPQTRCYVRFDDEWRIGRMKKMLDGEIEVDFPDAQSEFVSIHDVFVRCGLPIENPTDVLAHWGHETVYFYQHRKRFMEGLLYQRRASEGMHGLLSSSIRLLPHQVKTAQKVLEDPVPRYLLADEVGLGKTIEAGVVIRQMLLDKEKAAVLVLTPSSLCSQWQQELIAKFHIDQWPGQVNIFTTENIQSVPQDKNYDLVVIDEAHHITQWYFSQQSSINKNFLICQNIAHQAQGLLLLSATPALHNEEAFLCLLNLLDPLHFPLDKKDDFIKLINMREKIGGLLSHFQEKSPAVIIRRALYSLKELFSQDAEIAPVIDELNDLIAEGNIDPEKRNELIRKIRLLISEGYRIHRRIIRNRRNDVWKVQRTLPTEEFGEDDREDEILNALHDWRLDALLASEDDAKKRNQLEKCYFLFLSALGSSLEFLEILIDYRINKEHTNIVEQELESNSIKALGLPLFERELALLQNIKRAINLTDLDPFTKPMLLEGRLSILKESERTSKVVVFFSHTWVAKQLADYLSEPFACDSISFIHKKMDQETVQNEVASFRDSNTHWILLSDIVGEEGLNLQFADTIIHYDLPWSPNRIEQRIGRLDRIGQEKEIRSYVFLGTVEDEMKSPFLPYFSLLKESLGIFQKSINPLQFIIDSILPKFKTWLFEEGGNLRASKIEEKINTIKAEVEAEEKRIQGQDVLDSMSNHEGGEDHIFDDLQKLEKDPKQIQLHLEPWIKSALMFKTYTHEGITQYEWNQHTLIPTDILPKKLASETLFKGTYDRRLATEQEKEIIRVGNPFIDLLAEYFNWDDRGKAYAIWRHCHGISSEWCGYKFDLLVEANSTYYENFSSSSSIVKKTLGRRADGLLSPFLISVYVDLQGDIVQDQEVLSFLERNVFKYDSKKNYLGYDFNLTKERLDILRKNYTASQWQDYCKKACMSALSYLQESQDFTDRLKEGVRKVKLSISRREAQLKIHQRHNFKQNTNLLEKEREIGQVLLNSIENPSIKVDSVGFFWLSPNSLS